MALGHPHGELGKAAADFFGHLVIGQPQFHPPCHHVMDGLASGLVDLGHALGSVLFQECHRAGVGQIERDIGPQVGNRRPCSGLDSRLRQSLDGLLEQLQRLQLRLSEILLPGESQRGVSRRRRWRRRWRRSLPQSRFSGRCVPQLHKHPALLLKRPRKGTLGALGGLGQRLLAAGARYRLQEAVKDGQQVSRAQGRPPPRAASAPPPRTTPAPPCLPAGPPSPRGRAQLGFRPRRLRLAPSAASGRQWGDP